MGEVASAYVSVYPKISAGFAAELQTQMRKTSAGAFGPIEQESRKAGEKSAKTFGDSFKTGAKAILAGAAAVSVIKFVGDAVDAYSEQQDAAAAATVVFGDSMKQVEQQASSAARSIGIATTEALNGAITFGTYGKSAGLAGSKLATFSTDLVQLAGDMASFRGTSPEQAIEAIGAALRGETEPIRAYGVLLDDASVRQQALAMGLIKTTKEALTPQQRVLATQALILKQTSDAQGDYARTADSAANVQKTLRAESANLSAEIGEKLAPAIVAAQKAGIGLIQWVTDNQAAIIPFVGTMGTLVAAVGGFVAVAKGIEALKAARATLDALGESFQAMSVKARAATVSAGAIGIALTAASIVYGAFAQANADTAQHVEDLTRAIEADSGALGVNTRAAIANRLEKEGLTTSAAKFGVTIEQIASAAQGNTDAYDAIIAKLGEWSDAHQTTMNTLDRANALTDFQTRLKAVIGDVKAGEEKYGRLAQAQQDNTDATKSGTGATHDNTDAIKDNVEKLNAQYNASLRLRGDKRAFQAAIDDATDALKRNGKTLDIHTEKGRANQQALDNIASAALAVGGDMEQGRAAYIRAATAMGMSKKAAAELADKLGLIKSKNVDVTVDVHWGKLPGPAQVKFDGGKYTVKAPGGRYYTGGKIPGIALHDRDDSFGLASGDLGVPGEWVIQRAAVRHYGDGAMAAINAGRAQVRYADGGRIGSGGTLTADALAVAVAAALQGVRIDFGNVNTITEHVWGTFTAAEGAI